MREQLSAMEPHSDRMESNLGQFFQQKRKEPRARLQTVSSKVAIRSNKTVTFIRQTPSFMKALAKTRGIERKESSVTIKQHIVNISVAGKSHRDALRERIRKLLENRKKRHDLVNNEVLSHGGPCKTVTNIIDLLKKCDTKAKKVSALKHQIMYNKMHSFQNVKKSLKKLFIFSYAGKPLSTKQLANNLIEILKVLNPDLHIPPMVGELLETACLCPARVVPRRDPVPASEDVDNDVEEVDFSTFMHESDKYVFNKINDVVAIAFELPALWYPATVQEIISQDEAIVEYLAPVGKKNFFRCKGEKGEVESKFVFHSGLDIWPNDSKLRAFKVSHFEQVSLEYECFRTKSGWK